ncbi:cation/H(+) antiporter 15-like isoform X1 [Senna tora]|uniref:Cation/H(+) antiporter 15-like isoform X1 n=1 Tax=Senna tora TaxID=362788 RepID=A0A834SCW0_9FABA|nr:cation/H(+) antiporter 15-like isoform X1 [Senna tora]
MDSDNIAAIMQRNSSNSNVHHNLTAMCTTVDRITSKGVFFNTNPFHFSFPLLLCQCALCSIVIHITSILLKPLRQPRVISQILAGIMLGPSGLARNASLREMIFPPRSFMIIDVISSVAFMYYFFLLGLQMDPWILHKIDKKTSAIGFSAVVVPMTLTAGSYFLFVNNFPNTDPRLIQSLPIITQVESVLAFPVIACILSELKLLYSDFGRIALSASTVSALPSVPLVVLALVSLHTPGDHFTTLTILSTGVTITIIIFFIIRPVVLWMISNHPEGQPIKESHSIFLFLGVLVSGFCSQVTGLHAYFGPLVLGMAIPEDSPLGTAIKEKLEFVVSWILMPMFFLRNGLVIDIFEVRFSSYLVVQYIALIAGIGKFIGSFVTSLYCQIPVRDAAALGLLLNAQGILELRLFEMVKVNKGITNEAYVIMCMSLVIVTAIITPLVRFLYDPSRKYVVYERRSVIQSKFNSELRLLVCAHDQQNVPTLINLLEALNPTKQSPLRIYLLHLVRQFHNSSSSSFAPIIHAFTNYGKENLGVLTLHPFTSMSPYNLNQHDDVCSIAIKKRTSLIIMPFLRSAQILNKNVLHKAPCSVAFLVDHGSSSSSFSSSLLFRVVVLFLGGPDDREALAIAARMATNSNINVTVIRLLENGNVNNIVHVNERRLDNEVVGQFRINMTGNIQVMYIEEVVMDGSGTVSVVRSLLEQNNYELVIVGRRHDKKSMLVSSLKDWRSEESELGVIGELLVYNDFASKATILVVQQHISFVKEQKAMYIQKKLTNPYSKHDVSVCTCKISIS